MPESQVLKDQVPSRFQPGDRQTEHDTQPTNHAAEDSRYKEQGEFYDRRWLKGLEIVNGSDYDPIVHGWNLRKKLTMLADSDVHDPILMDLDSAAGEHRPMTLVFATERSAGAIKEALFSRRTAVYSQNLLIGDEAFVKVMFTPKA